MDQKPTNSHKRGSISLAVLAACIIGIGVGLISLNFWHASRCVGSQSNEEMANYIAALEKRLLQAESQNYRNSIIMEKIIYSIQSRVVKIENKEMDELMKHAQDEAVRIALLLATQPAPPMPDFPIDSKYEDASELADVIDDVLDRVGEETSSKYVSGDTDKYSSYLDKIEPEVSETEAIKACNEWKKLYEVVIGVSWGKLPYDLQQKWMTYHCDLHLSSEK